MLEPEDILGGLLRGALGGRGRPWRHTHRALGQGLINPSTILAAAGVAWGLFETWRQQRSPSPTLTRAGDGAPLATSPSAGPRPTSPPMPAAAAPATEADETSLPPAILQLMRLMISAARADGEIGPAERERILAEAREVGASAEVERELETRRPLGEIVAGVSDPELKQQLYALGYTIVRADLAVTGGERIYLAQLANRLQLDAATVGRLEAEVDRRIEAARVADAGQSGEAR